MLKSIALAAFAAGALQLSSGCAVNRATATVTPGADIGATRSYYVVKVPADQRGIQDLIRDGLARRGYSAKVGVDPAPPPGVDVLVTYVDRWMWDITMYMVELTIVFRNPANQFPLATGNSFHTSLTRKSPEEMVDEVLGNIFDKAKGTK
jgi:hypothetical protein